MHNLERRCLSFEDSWRARLIESNYIKVPKAVIYLALALFIGASFLKGLSELEKLLLVRAANIICSL